MGDTLGRTYTAGEPDDDFLIILVLFIDSWEEPEEHLVFFIGLVADWQKARVRLAYVEIDFWDSSSIDGKLCANISVRPGKDATGSQVGTYFR